MKKRNGPRIITEYTSNQCAVTTKTKGIRMGQTGQIISMLSVRIPCAALITQTLKKWHKLQRAWEQGMIRMSISYQESEESF